MNTIHKIRTYHAILAITAILAYVTGGLDLTHAYIGYTVTAIVIFRLLWATSNDQQLNLKRFIPNLKTLNPKTLATNPATSKIILLILTTSLIGTVATGIAMDKGQTLGISNTTIVKTAYADNDEPQRTRERRRERNGFIKEAHETLASIFLLSTIIHIIYLLTFRRPMARFMLFLK